VTDEIVGKAVAEWRIMQLLFLWRELYMRYDSIKWRAVRALLFLQLVQTFRRKGVFTRLCLIKESEKLNFPS
jgi:hypothetical protein